MRSYLKEAEANKVDDLVNYTAQMIIDPLQTNYGIDLEYDFYKYFEEFYKGNGRPLLVQAKNKLIFPTLKNLAEICQIMPKKLFGMVERAVNSFMVRIKLKYNIFRKMNL